MLQTFQHIKNREVHTLTYHRSSAASVTESEAERLKINEMILKVWALTELWRAHLGGGRRTAGWADRSGCRRITCQERRRLMWNTENENTVSCEQDSPLELLFCDVCHDTIWKHAIPLHANTHAEEHSSVTRREHTYIKMSLDKLSKLLIHLRTRTHGYHQLLNYEC